MGSGSGMAVGSVTERLGCALALGVLIAGCGGSARPVVVLADDPGLHYIGWFDRRVPDAPRFAWPGTQVTARFTGTSIRARLTDTPLEDDTRELDWITVVIDDGRPETFKLAEGLHVYPLATNLSNGTHRVVVWKRTEAEVGTITFHGFELEAGERLLPVTKRAKRRLVFVGDSITVGYGNEGFDASCHGNASRQNNYETYGAHAARELGAEYVAMAWSGKGVTRNYDERDRVTLPELYDRVIPTEDDSPRIPKTTPADVVVVNLGTNDFLRGIPDHRAFTSGYGRFLRALHRRFPGALFVLGLGPMLSDDYPHANARTLMRGFMQAARESTSTGGDTQVELMELWTDPAEGVGCDVHPNKKTHARLGRELAEMLRKRLGW